ncbi:MAG TPA: serine/threonine-protein kinase [Polyangiaceae bacterium]|nr:serine/threonine-protein kinase [Polyangiaceae bacterium]
MEASRAHISTPSDEPLPRRIADRYDVECLLGKGGMATAYRADDAVTGNKVALKLLSPNDSREKAARDVELFEREYQTLVQLAHPRVVQAYEYGVHEGAPYYTMELLDGGDLQTLAPMPWQEAAAAAYEICSALSMLHSRRLVHRDLTPRNVRRTNDGKAKLLDFGLLSPMGPPELLAGTPPFVAPELVNSVSLDGRSDLFSLGATLYFVLTGRHAFPARRFDQLRDVWRSNPRAPSKLVPGIPMALDAIVLALLRIDAGSRPKNAAEVMERLLPLLGRAPDDDLRVAAAHLTTPRLVGPTSNINAFRKRVLRAARRHGGGFLLLGDAGTGRSRMLDAFVLESKLAGATAVRAGASNAGAPFGVVAALAARLHAASPSTSVAAARRDPAVFSTLFQDARAATAPEAAEHDLVDLTAPHLDHRALHTALRAWLLELAKARTLSIAVDDFDQIDEASAALLASVASQAKKHCLVYAFGVETKSMERGSTALDIVQKHAEEMVLEPLDLAQTSELLASMFGDVPNLQLLSRRLYGLCAGRPRECVMLAQFLVDRGVITYGGGSFTLPSEIPEGMLPASVEESLAEQLGRLKPAARRAAGLLALEITERLSRAQLARALASPASAVDVAVDELVTLRIVSGDASGYQHREATLTRLLATSLSEDERRDMHDRLSELERTVSTPLASVYHELNGGNPERGLVHLLPLIQESEARVQLVTGTVDELGGARSAEVLKAAVAVAERTNRPKRDLQSLWVMLAGVAAIEDARCFYELPPAWLDQLKRDSGWSDWQGLDASLEGPTRSMMAVGMAAQRYGALAEPERVLSPPDAIRQLVGYVVFAIAVGARVHDLPLQASLPELLVPFAPLDPTVRVMLANARGTLLNGLGKREAARQIFAGLVHELDSVADAPGYLHKVKAAILQTLAEIDASLGVTSPFTERLDREAVDAYQRVGARYVQKVTALHQGDWEAAERFRQQAELEMLQSRVRPMFSTLGQELEAHAMARDLTGLRQVRAAIHKMAEKYPGWAPVRRVADAQYQRLCGELEAALATAREARSAEALAALRSPWVFHSAAIEAEVLLDLGRPAEGLEAAKSALAECEREGMRCFARALSSAAALCEAKLGDFQGAAERLERIVAEQQALGITGLALGRSYEYRARIAIWALDVDAFERFAKLTAERYRPGESSVLGALYERLMEEARLAGIGVEGQIHSMKADERNSTHTSSWESVSAALSSCADRRTRAERALSLLCEGTPPRRGHLYLLGSAGLELVATNDLRSDAQALLKFAQERLDAELEPSATITGILETAAMTSYRLTWTDSAGVEFTTVLLAAPDEDGAIISGVLVLAEEGSRGRHFDEIVAAVTRASIESGDAIGLRPM